jgi:hypothetical protein
MVKQKNRYGELMPVNGGLIFIYCFGSSTHFSCQDLASHIKISQIIYFLGVFSGKKTLAYGET